MRIGNELVGNGVRYLVVDISDNGELLAVCDLNSKQTKRPIAFKQDFVLKMLESNAWTEEEHYLPEHLFKKDEEFSTKWRDKRDFALLVLSPLIAEENRAHLEQYLYGDTSGIISGLMKTSGRSKKYITNRLNRWFRFLCIPNGLLPAYGNCGKNYKLRKEPVFLHGDVYDLSSKPGPKTKYGNSYRHATQADFENIKMFSKNIKPNATVCREDLYLRFVSQYMSMEILPKTLNNQEEVHGIKMMFPRRHLISPRTFKRYLNKIISGLNWIRKLEGEIGYAKDRKGKPGSARKGLRYPGQRFEIDATIADVHILYPYSKKERLSCGRPVVYFVVDTWSSMVVGFHVAFDGPNWAGATQALYNAFEDKVEFCRRWGISIDREQWPCDHICEQIVWDRGGENTDKHLTAILRAKIGIRLMKLNAYHRGDAKGTVEKMFDIVLKKAIKFVAGVVSKIVRKEDQDPSRSPALTYEKFMQRIIKVILTKNNNSIKKDSHNFEMEATGIEYTPLDIWNFGRDSTSDRPKVSKDRIRFALLPDGDAVITDKGVRFRGLMYSSAEVEKWQWLDKAKNFGHYKIKIRYMDATTNHIWYFDENSKRMIRLDLLDRSEAYKNQVWANVLHRLELRKHELALLDERKYNAEILLDMDLHDMDKTTEASIKKRKRSYSKSRQSGIQERKDVVAAAHRTAQAEDVINDLNDAQANTSPTPKSQDPATSDQDLTDPTISDMDE